MLSLYAEDRKMMRATILLVAALVATSALAGEKVRYVHTDAAGSVRVLTDEAGNVVGRRDYLPFGEEWCGAAVCGSVTLGQPRRFTGKERDVETGLDYFGARYFRPNLGRFTTVDPGQKTAENLIDSQRWNRYAYALNNPFKFIDPDGRDALWVKHPNGTATLVIPVKFSGSGATDANVAAMVANANRVTVADPNVSIQVISTDTPLSGKLNRLDVSPGLDTRMCGPPGQCVNTLGGNRGHIDSNDHDVIDAAKHEVFHFAGIRDAYRELEPDEQGRRRSEPLPGYSDSNVMTSRAGTELKTSQTNQAKNNRSTKKCSGEGARCNYGCGAMFWSASSPRVARLPIKESTLRQARPPCAHRLQYGARATTG
jgi:RHS repeat-associated protein